MEALPFFPPRPSVASTDNCCEDVLCQQSRQDLIALVNVIRIYFSSFICISLSGPLKINSLDLSQAFTVTFFYRSLNLLKQVFKANVLE